MAGHSKKSKPKSAPKPASSRRTPTRAKIPSAAKPSIRGQTLRLNIEAWRELKFLSIDQGRPAHDLLIEAVNDLFKKYKKRQLA